MISAAASTPLLAVKPIDMSARRECWLPGGRTLHLMMGTLQKPLINALRNVHHGNQRRVHHSWLGSLEIHLLA